MLPLFQEYDVNHFRFKEHHRIATIMALVAPVCALVIYQQLQWWNPWLWGCGGVGLAIALALHSTVLIVRKPKNLSLFSRKLADNSHEWFPFFFVVLQSSIASLITIFVWFSITTLALSVPFYVHAVLVALAVLLPVRRFIWAKMVVLPPPAYEKANEIFHGTAHILASIFVARCIIALTVADPESTSVTSVMWQILIWIPAGIYMVYTTITMIYHLIHGKQRVAKTSPPQSKPESEEPVDKF